MKKIAIMLFFLPFLFDKSWAEDCIYGNDQCVDVAWSTQETCVASVGAEFLLYYAFEPYSSADDVGVTPYIPIESWTEVEVNSSCRFTNSVYFDSRNMPDNTLIFISMSHFMDGEESGRSPIRILWKMSGTSMCAQVEAVPTATGVSLSWQVPSGLAIYNPVYTVVVKNEGGTTVATQQVAGSTVDIVLPNGNYTAEISSILLGNIITNLEYEAASFIADVLPTPKAKVELIGTTVSALQVLVGVEETADARVDKYKYYIASTESLAGAKTAEIASGIIDAGSNILSTINATGRKNIAVAVTYYDSVNDEEGMPVVVSRVPGDIITTNWDGTIYEATSCGQMVVDGADLAFMKENYTIPVVHRSANWATENDLYNLLPFTSNERADYNKSGSANVVDNVFLKANAFNRCQ